MFKISTPISITCKKQDEKIILTIIVDEEEGGRIEYSSPLDDKKIFTLYDLLHRYIWDKQHADKMKSNPIDLYLE